MALRRLLVFLTFAGLVAFVASAAPVRAASDAPSSVTIAYQPGLSYATLIVMKEQGTLEKQFPGTKFAWRVLGNGAAIRDGIIAGQIQIGAGGVGPFLIGWDKGVGYRLIGSLNEMDLWLVTMDPKIKSLKDIKPGMRIGMPGIDAIQAIVLKRGAERELGNAHALDQNIVAIPHPLGLQALEHGQLMGHLTSPPFQFEEVAAGGHVILHSFDLFGVSTFNSVYTTEAFYDGHKDFVKAFYQSLKAATAFVKSHPNEAAELLSRDSGGKATPAQFDGWLTHKGLAFETTPHGFLAYGKFMQQIG
ncbi:MAG: ABC transporter substrate-binding protein, partial [bacterium]|nr:ABC transporter substrate-binding protein [bacterium]